MNIGCRNYEEGGTYLRATWFLYVSFDRCITLHKSAQHARWCLSVDYQVDSSEEILDALLNSLFNSFGLLYRPVSAISKCVAQVTPVCQTNFRKLHNSAGV